jgi:DNA-binding CsgD family transcriptional regulator
MTAKVSENDVRSIVRILAEVGGSSESLKVKRQALLQRIMVLIEADAWYWGVVGQSTPGELPTFAVQQKGGFSDEQYAKFLKAQGHPEMASFNEPLLAELQKGTQHFTRLRQQLDPSNKFPDSGAYELWREADLGAVIISTRKMNEFQTTVIGLFRSFERPLFTERENRIAHILLSEVPWLHDENWSDTLHRSFLDLSRRLHDVTNLLVQGMGRKQIASELNLSVHTVNDYVKDIYARFEVHSQGQLVHRFLHGDGGDST